MKLTCQSHRKNALFYAFAVSITFIGCQSMANPFNDGTTNSIGSDTTYDETLYIGIQNPDNALLIENNARVSAESVVIGQLTSSTNNSVSVSGGSFLIVGNTDVIPLVGGVIVGGTDGGAALSINNNSTLNAEYLYVGLVTDESGRIDLAGEGTELTVGQDVYLGTGGSTNFIEITDGANLSVGGTLTVGSVSSSNNHINVTSGGSLFVNETNSIIVVNADDDNGIVINADSTLQVGGDAETGTFEELGVELRANANLELGGALTLDQNEIDSRLNIILNNELSTNTASWSSASLTSIGSSTSGNSLTFTNGATGLAANIIQIGQQSTSAGNELNIGGSNSLFIADSDVFVGAQGKNNALNVSDGGQVDIAGTLYLGGSIDATANEVSINSNSTLNVTGDVIVGDQSNNNKFNLEGGMVDVANHFILGNSANADGITYNDTANIATVGTNGTMDIHQDLTVGMDGNGNIFNIRDGGKLTVDGDAIIGKASDDNYIFLMPDNADTLFNVAGDLVIGVDGEDNRFSIYGGTANIAVNLYLGASTNQHDLPNYIHLQTTNAVLNVANEVHIGASNSVNQFRLVAGATMNAQDLFVGTHDGTSNNTVTISGELYDGQQGIWLDYVADSLVHVTNSLVIGNTNGANNSVIVRDGGILNVTQTNIVISGTNNVLQIIDGGTLKTVDWDYSLLTGTATNILLESGSTLHLLGALTGTNKVTGGLNVVLDGTNALWDTGTNALFIGDTGDDNSLTITNGALAATSTNLYIGFASVNNSVTVGGTGSVLQVGHDLMIGNVDEEPSGRSALIIAGGGYVNADNDAYLVHGSRLKVDSASQMKVAGDFEQDRFSTLEVGISANQTAPNLLVDGKANLESGATISIFNDGIDKNDTNVVQEIVVSDKLTIDGQSATTTLLLSNITIVTNLLLDFSVTVTNGNTIVVDNFIVYTLGEAAGLEGQLEDVADEIGMMATNGNPKAESMLRILDALGDASAAEQTMDNYYGEKMSSSPAHNAINMGMQTVAEQLSMRADSTRARMGLASTSSPEGTGGPHMAGQALQGWAAGYKTWVDMSSDSGFDGYDGDIDGFLIGADMSVAEGILVGIAGGAGSANLDKDSNSASTDTDTTYGSIYLSAGTKDWFAEAGLIYGDSSVDLDLGSAFDTEADYDAQNTAIYVGGGKEIIGDYLIITPHVSLLANYYDQDSYREKSSNAVGREVESFDELYVQSELGCSVAFYTTLGKLLIKPEFRASWLHEFKADEEDLTYTLIDGTNPYVMTLQAPEEDIIRLGAGMTAKLGEYIELRADLDTRQGSEYSDYTLLGSLRYQF